MIINICKVQFLTIFTYQETDNVTNYMLLPVTIKIGKKVFNHYINLLKNNYLEESKQPKDSLRYSM